MTVSMRGWTYGAEHELADWPLSTPLPAGYKRDVRDFTIVNSNGIANDPTGRLYGYGGEINTPPTDSEEGQVQCLQEIKALLPMAKVNYRSNLHVHIRAPGLGQDLETLKRVQRYIHENMRKVLRHIQQLPKPTAQEHPDREELEGAWRRWRRRRVSHQTLLTSKRLAHQLEAPTLEEFYAREVPRTQEGRPLWHLQPRLCVNLRQHKETDTVEFRHFAGTLDEGELRTCVSWCNDFLHHAIMNLPIEDLLEAYDPRYFPTFPKYDHRLEVRYRQTVHDGSLRPEQIAANIRRILEEDGQ